VAVGERTSLNRLLEALRKRLLPHCPHLMDFEPVRQGFRAGDVRHSLADINKARRLLGYKPDYGFEQGLEEALDWYLANLSAPADGDGARPNRQRPKFRFQ